MQRLLVFLTLGLLSLGLNGCILTTITDASPDTSVLLEMQPGDKMLFKVEGPVTTAITKCTWTVWRRGCSRQFDYEPRYNNVSWGSNEFLFEVNPDGEPTNRIVIYCDVKQLTYSPGISGWEGGFFWNIVDTRKWEVRIIQQRTPPTWQGSYSINDNTDVQLLSQYTRVAGDLFIFGPDRGTTIEGLNNLTTVDGSLYVIYFDDTTSLAGLDNLTTVGELDIESNRYMTNLSGLQKLTRVEGDLMIDGSWLANLTSLGLDSLCFVKGDFNITYNRYLCTYLVEDLRDQVIACQGIGGAVNIQGNKACVNP